MQQPPRGGGGYHGIKRPNYQREAEFPQVDDGADLEFPPPSGGRNRNNEELLTRNHYHQRETSGGDAAAVAGGQMVCFTDDC